MPPPRSSHPADGTDALFAQVYDRLKAMAGHRLAGNARESLDATALVHELYLRVSSIAELRFEHPNQFYGYAARAMRHLLADRARNRLRLRAGGEWVQVTLTGSDSRLALESAEQVHELDQALHRLEDTDERSARVVELSWFAGIGQEQIADILSVDRSTVARDLRFARAFLKNELGE